MCRHAIKNNTNLDHSTGAFKTLLLNDFKEDDIEQSPCSKSLEHCHRHRLGLGLRLKMSGGKMPQYWGNTFTVSDISIPIAAPMGEIRANVEK